MGLVLIVFSVVLYLDLSELSENVKVFPQVILFVIIVNASLMMLKAFRGSNVEGGNERTFSKSVIILIALLFVYYCLISILGFYTSSLLFTLASYLLLKKNMEKSVIITGGIFSISFMVVVYIVFNLLLNLVTPKGLFF